jgi:hypothetical protein
MSFMIPIPKHLLRPYLEYLKGLEQEYVIEPGFQRTEVNNLAFVWVQYMDAADQYAKHADQQRDSGQYLARTRAIRRVLNVWAARYSSERERITAFLRRREPEPASVETGRALVAARGGTRGNSGSSTRLHDVYTRMKRDQQSS